MTGWARCVGLLLRDEKAKSETDAGVAQSAYSLRLLLEASSTS